MINSMQHRNEELPDHENYGLKLRLIDYFYKTVTENMTDAGCRYFAHSLIRNREEPMRGSFSEKPNNRHMKYWEHYWNSDPQDYEVYTVLKKVGSACNKPPFQMPLGFDFAPKGKSKGTLNKTEMCKMKDGFHFYVQHYEDIQENFSFGWEKHDANQVDCQKIRDFNSKLNELGIGYFRLNPNMLDTFPAFY